MAKVHSFNRFNVITDEDELPLLCGIKEMSRFFQCTDSTVRKRCERGKIEGAFLKGSRWYIHKKDLLNWGKEVES